LISLERQPVFEGLGLEQHWHPPWLLLELIMPPKKSKISMDKAGPSMAATVATAVEAAVRNDATTATKPPALQPQIDNTAALGGQEQMPKGDV
jgi:hypothetical protein